MSTCDGRPTETKAILEAEAQRFREMYPRSSVRFAEAIGRRVSHVAGAVHELHVGERQLRVNARVLMFVDDRDGISDEELERFAVQVAALLGDDGGV